MEIAGDFSYLHVRWAVKPSKYQSGFVCCKALALQNVTKIQVKQIQL